MTSTTIRPRRAMLRDLLCGLAAALAVVLAFAPSMPAANAVEYNVSTNGNGGRQDERIVWQGVHSMPYTQTTVRLRISSVGPNTVGLSHWSGALYTSGGALFSGTSSATFGNWGSWGSHAQRQFRLGIAIHGGGTVWGTYYYWSGSLSLTGCNGCG